MKKRLGTIVLAAAMLCAMPIASIAQTTTAQTQEQMKVVYHLTEGTAQASKAMGNIRNHLNADPTAKIVVVTHGAGIDFLLLDAKDAKGQGYEGVVSDLASKGVEFRVCNNTLVSRKMTSKDVLMEAKIVPSGVVEVTRLQAKEGYSYLKP